MIPRYKLDYPYHLCPICGRQSETSSRICSKHTSITYDLYGNPIEFLDVVNRIPNIRSVANQENDENQHISTG